MVHFQKVDRSCPIFFLYLTIITNRYIIKIEKARQRKGKVGKMKKINVRLDYDISFSEQDERELLEEHGIKTEFELEHFFKSELMETLKEQDCVVNKVFVKVNEE